MHCGELLGLGIPSLCRRVSLFSVQDQTGRTISPVCGMFVAKYPDFLPPVIFRDDSYALFDGAKDMFKYYFNLKKYNPSKELSDIAVIYVTDYYSMKPTDGRKAYYVVESNVFGPMGRELIPFEKEPEAKEFLVDHAGKKLIRFDGVTPELIKGLD